MSKERRWGSVDQIDKRTKVGSASWKQRHSRSIQHLSAYRRLHQLSEHKEARELVDAPVSAKLEAIRKLEQKDE